MQEKPHNLSQRSNSQIITMKCFTESAKCWLSKAAQGKVAQWILFKQFSFPVEIKSDRLRHWQMKKKRTGKAKPHLLLEASACCLPELQNRRIWTLWYLTSWFPIAAFERFFNIMINFEQSLKNDTKMSNNILCTFFIHENLNRTGPGWRNCSSCS
jgi:hypothetical protein